MKPQHAPTSFPELEASLRQALARRQIRGVVYAEWQGLVRREKKRRLTKLLFALLAIATVMLVVYVS